MLWRACIKLLCIGVVGLERMSEMMGGSSDEWGGDSLSFGMLLLKRTIGVIE